MKILAGLVLVPILALAACRSERSPPKAPQVEAKGPPAPHRLPGSIVPKSDTLTDFGIDLAKVAPKDAAVVRSA